MSVAVSPRPAVIGTAVWLAAATAVGATGALASLRTGPQVVALVLTISAVLVSTRVAAVRESVDALSLRALLAPHVARFIGIVFLLMGARAELSTLFAERAGWGDIAAAAGALLLILIGSATAARRRMLLLWNAFGVLDLLVAVGTAAIVVQRGDAPGMQPLARLPLILVPIFAVPLLFAAHVAIFRRLRDTRDAR